MGNRNTPRKQVKRRFKQTQTHLDELFNYTNIIRAFHEGRDTEKDLYDFLGLIQDKIAELSIFMDVACFRFKTGKWPEKTDADPNGSDQEGDPGHDQGNAVRPPEAEDNGSAGTSTDPPAGEVGD